MNARITEYRFGKGQIDGLTFRFEPIGLDEHGTVDGFKVTLYYVDLELFAKDHGIDTAREDWLAHEEVYEAIHDTILDAIPFLTYRFFDSVADEAGEVWYYTTHNLDYHASKHGVTVRDEVVA